MGQLSINRLSHAGVRPLKVFVASGLLLAVSPGRAEPLPDLARKIAALMREHPSGQAGQRFVHAKGIVCEGTFQPSADAAMISRASHFQSGSVPVVVRFSNGAPEVSIADNSPNAGPQGMSIRFMTGRGTDIVAMSHNGFVVANGEEFLALQEAIVATDPSQSHPQPIEKFLGSHPRALKFVQDNASVPASFATEAFYGNDAFRFINKDGMARAGRYQIVPEEAPRFLDAAEAKSKSPDFLREDLTARLAKVPVRFPLRLQLAGAGDRTDDPSEVWPDDRKVVELGVITLTSVAADSAGEERKLAFDPARLTDGIELSDDPLPKLRSLVYAISAAPRRATDAKR